MKRSGKIVVSIVGIVLLCLVVFVISSSFWTFNQIKASAAARKHVYIVMNNAHAIFTDLLNAETGQRGYLLTGDKDFLEPYRAVRNSVSVQLSELIKITTNPEARKHLEEMSPLIAVKMRELSYVLDLQTKNDRAAAIDVVKGGKGKRVMDSIRIEVIGFIQAEEGALDKHDSDFRSSMRLLLGGIIATCVFALLFAFLGTYFTYEEEEQFNAK